MHLMGATARAVSLRLGLGVLGLLALPVVPLRAQSAGTSERQPPGVREQAYFAFQVTTPAVYLVDSTISPHPVHQTSAFPNLVQFMVDTLGRVEAGTFRVLRGQDSPIVKDALTVLNRWRFRPARVGEEPVRQLVQTELGW